MQKRPALIFSAYLRQISDQTVHLPHYLPHICGEYSTEPVICRIIRRIFAVNNVRFAANSNLFAAFLREIV